MEKNSLSGKVDLLLIGGSAGSLDVILKVVAHLKRDLSFPIVIILHRKASSDSSLINLLNSKSPLITFEAEEKELLHKGYIYVAPADYHLLIEKDHTLSLDYSEKIQYSRPCIDITFETAAQAFNSRLAGILLSGANSDGTMGLRAIKQYGGITAVQNPLSAEVSYMPAHALKNVEINYVLEAEEIAYFINNLSL